MHISALPVERKTVFLVIACVHVGTCADVHLWALMHRLYEPFLCKPETGLARTSQSKTNVSRTKQNPVTGSIRSTPSGRAVICIIPVGTKYKIAGLHIYNKRYYHYYIPVYFVFDQEVKIQYQCRCTTVPVLTNYLMLCPPVNPN